MADWKNVLYTRNAVLAGLIVVVLLVLYVVERDRERNSEEIAGNQSTSTPQFVTFSFDGSRSKDMWEEKQWRPWAEIRKQATLFSPECSWQWRYANQPAFIRW